ncbi:IS30 family transposase [Malacoplasma iowae]|uniref:IS30 family transposase n=1 Tax=Malacoplasma iowae 695 TaxID=1048830 RepID=A0A6P1LLV8_MALIO|nr:IS30 family transposase [Malacoplasma iowae]VEU62994.1 Transposase and inactivated derivatives, IS30 family [Mycoplasmopsis fermentans]QHG89482.1 IS30 family transposase [Malacoplasma iowae 695]WPL35747.1 IS30 family transposase [Malacoplasma iowae]WPL40087.1 IS30 family transposase [Malacoplasma iowae]VEU71741.1 Transposase and inactivated derivatives, IS30 family [Malacoplasma iowae]
MGITTKQLNFKVYYCQHYSSFQGCTNENINGLVRRWYKKGTYFNLVSEDKIRILERKVNNIPRKFLVIKHLMKCTKKIFKKLSTYIIKSKV